MYKKLFNKLPAIGLLAFSLTGSTAFAENFKQQSVPTEQINIFEQEDEKKTFNSHGFTRGDITYLYTGEVDTNKMENISGKVDDVFRVQYPDNDCYVIAIISTANNNGQMAVNLGPTWFLDEQDYSVNEGDSVQIKGWKMRTNGRHLLVASEINKNGKTVTVRDKNAAALWGSPKVQKGDADCMKPEKKKGMWLKSS